MINNIAKFIYIIFIIFIAWLVISWIEVTLLNIDGIEISSWNFFKIIPKIF